jgi:hypothetical protein
MSARVHILGPSLVSVHYAPGWLARVLGARDVDAKAFRGDRWRWSVGGLPVTRWARRAIDRAMAQRELARREAADDGHDICWWCGAEIDPATCHCGVGIGDHGYGSGHGPVPMGCVCHLERGDR